LTQTGVICPDFAPVKENTANPILPAKQLEVKHIYLNKKHPQKRWN
jgi:hypothetical protein